MNTNFHNGLPKNSIGFLISFCFLFLLIWQKKFFTGFLINFYCIVEIIRLHLFYIAETRFYGFVSVLDVLTFITACVSGGKGRDSDSYTSVFPLHRVNNHGRTPRSGGFGLPYFITVAAATPSPPPYQHFAGADAGVRSFFYCVL